MYGQASIGGWIVGLLLAAAGAGWVAVRQRRKHRALRGWRKVRGRIREARTCEVVVDDSQVGPVTRFEPLVLYDYRFEGGDYVGARIGLDPADHYATRSEAQAQVRRFVEGHEIEVFVDPAHPNHALLDSRVKAGWTLPLLGLAGLIALIALITWRIFHGPA